MESVTTFIKKMVLAEVLDIEFEEIKVLGEKFR